ncbi:unnamed protein product [Alopecurus aequalis]
MDPARLQQALSQPQVQALLRSLGGGQWTVESTRAIHAFQPQLHNANGDDDTASALAVAYESLPDPPVTPDAPLGSAVAAAWAAANDGVDRISHLPDQILKNVVARLPARDAVRTGALAARWRGLWRAVPLVFVDTHLLPPARRADPVWRPGLEDTLGITNAVSGVLAAHPGPFRCVQITCCYLDLNPENIDGWLQHLAAKGVQELAFINRPWPLDLPLSAALFSCTSLTRLHIGAWKFPDTASLPRTAAFPHLRNLSLNLMAMTDRDLAFMLDRSPVLEVLSIVASQSDVSLCVVSHSLRCLHLTACSLVEIDVADAPSLERLFLLTTEPGRRLARIKIGKAPNLRMLGYWNPGQHELQIGNTAILGDSKVSPSTTVPSVRILGLEMNFEARLDAKRLSFFLKCFPDVETLHIDSMNVTKPMGKVDLKFWQEAGPVECLQQHVKKLVIHSFQAKRSELAFLKFIAERAEVLENMVIIMTPQCSSSMNSVKSKLGPLAIAKWASKDFKVILFRSAEPEGSPAPWCFHTATDFACADPFDLGTGEDKLSSGAVFHSSGN